MFQVRQARKEASAAHLAQRRERRIDFELTVLRELLIAANEGDVLRVHALASTVSEDVVPITRAAAGLPTTPEAKLRVEGLNLGPETHRSAHLDRLKDDVMAELLKAIGDLLRERDLMGGINF